MNTTATPVDYFSAWPSELILAMLDLLEPKDILQVGLTSRRYHEVAVDDQIWLPITVDLMKPHTDPSQFDIPLHDLLVQNSKQLAVMVGVDPEIHNPVYQFYTKFLGRYWWLLGWAVHAVNEQLWRISIRISPDGPRTSIGLPGPSRGVSTPEEVAEPEVDSGERSGEENDTQLHASSPEAPFIPPRIYLPYIPPCLPPLDTTSTFCYIAGEIMTTVQVRSEHCTGSLHGVPIDSSDDVVDSFEIRDGGHSWSVEGFRQTKRRPIEQRSFPPQFVIGGDLLVRVGRSGQAKLKRGFTRVDIPDPRQRSTPGRFPLLPHLHDAFQRVTLEPSSTRLSVSHVEVAYAGLPFLWGMGLLVLIHAPSYYPRSTTNLLCDGIYVGPYGFYGWEYVVVRTRTLTEDDLRRREVAIGKEKEVDTLAVLSEELRPALYRRISNHPARIGDKILDVVKLTGDDDIPRSYRSFIAFLDDPRVDRRLSEQHLPEGPTATEGVLPWPAVYNASGEVKLQRPFAPLRGVDLPGVARAELDSYGVHCWTDCTVHVESRTQFTVLREDLARASIFTKIEDW